VVKKATELTATFTAETHIAVVWKTGVVPWAKEVPAATGRFPLVSDSLSEERRKHKVSLPTSGILALVHIERT